MSGWTILYGIINFAILAGALVLIGRKLVVNMIRSRREKIEHDLQSAQEARETAASLRESLRDGDRILLAEGCTHHRQCNDIGTVKIPRWLKAHTGKDLVFETCSGSGFPEDLTPYRLVIHCGGCMLTVNAVLARMRQAEKQEVPFTNYGIAIAFMTGALERSLRLFPALHSLLPEDTE